MFHQLLIFSILYFKAVNTATSPNSFTEIFAAVDNSTDVSEQCLKDGAVFVESLSLIFTTLQKCRENNGCTDEENKILNENMFAIKQIDAFGKIPAGLLEMTLISSGSYRECMELVAPYQVHYCYAEAVSENMTSTTLVTASFRIAVCMPRSCTEEDIPKLLTSLDVQSRLPLKFIRSNCVPTSVRPSTGFWIFMSFMAIFIAWAIIATVIDYVLNVYYEKKPGNSMAMRILLSYSVYTNGSAILETGPYKEGNIKSLASIRFISMTWVAAGHTLLQNANSDTLLPVFSIWNPFLSTTFMNAFLSVDTFFLLSGILVAYLFFKSKPSVRYVKNPFTWVMFYVHRYLRLTPAVMIFIGFFTVMLPLINGPFTASAVGMLGNNTAAVEVCKKYWWRNMLYINNFFGMTAECYPITWYLAVDTQLYIVAPIFLVTLLIRPLLGAALLVLASAVSVAYVYVITFRDNLPASLMGVFALPHTEEFFDEFYQKPWNRCTPYLIGIAAGYLLAMGKKPKVHWLVISSAWAIATAVALACLFGPYHYIKGDDNWSEFTRASYNNFSRIGWSLAVSWVIIANHLGWGGPVATFMDHPLWKPLGRLSYCGYIVHFFVITYIFNIDDRPYHYVSIWGTYVYRVIPVVVMSYGFAFVWSCLFEVPIVKLEKILIEGIMPAKKDEKPKFYADGKNHERIYAYEMPQDGNYQMKL